MELILLTSSFSLLMITDDLQGEQSHQKSGKTVMLTLIESSFGHFMTHVIETKKDGQRNFASWIK